MRGGTAARPAETWRSLVPDVAVTGSTGAVGGRVARLLSAAGVPTLLVGRDPARLPSLPGAEHGPAAEYRDTAAMTAALRGVRTLLLVSARESADRLVEHRSAVDAAAAAGVQHVVYTSFLGAAPDCVFTLGRDHWHTEQHLRASGMAWTFLRDSLYSDFLPGMAGDDGVLRGPAGDGRVSAVAQDDVAEVAVTVLRDPSVHEGASYDVTGPEALTLDEVAATITAVTGRAVRYERETVEEAYASRAVYGAPDFEVAGWVTSYEAIAAGEALARGRRRAAAARATGGLPGRAAAARLTRARPAPEPVAANSSRLLQ
nr:SDR family oxidoreductase [Angustibacter aerolatus]